MDQTFKLSLTAKTGNAFLVGTFALMTLACVCGLIMCLAALGHANSGAVLLFVLLLVGCGVTFVYCIRMFLRNLRLTVTVEEKGITLFGRQFIPWSIIEEVKVGQNNMGLTYGSFLYRDQGKRRKQHVPPGLQGADYVLSMIQKHIRTNKGGA